MTITNDLVGKKYLFPDGNSITVTQIKKRDGNELWVTYHIQHLRGIPRKEVSTMHDFVNNFGHLFDLSKTDDTTKT